MKAYFLTLTRQNYHFNQPTNQPTKMGVKEKAKEMVNMIYQPLGLLNIDNSSDEMWNWSKKIAIENTKIIKSQIPMYTGNLNPTWKLWNDVENEIIKL